MGDQGMLRADYVVLSVEYSDTLIYTMATRFSSPVHS